MYFVQHVGLWLDGVKQSLGLPCARTSVSYTLQELGGVWEHICGPSRSIQLNDFYVFVH